MLRVHRHLADYQQRMSTLNAGWLAPSTTELYVGTCDKLRARIFIAQKELEELVATRTTGR